MIEGLSSLTSCIVCIIIMVQKRLVEQIQGREKGVSLSVPNRISHNPVTCILR